MMYICEHSVQPTIKSL